MKEYEKELSRRMLNEEIYEKEFAQEPTNKIMIIILMEEKKSINRVFDILIELETGLLNLKPKGKLQRGQLLKNALCILSFPFKKYKSKRSKSL